MQFLSKRNTITAEQFWPDKKPWPPDVQKWPNSPTGYCVWNELHVTHIPIKPGDWVRIDMPADRYPIDQDYFIENYAPKDREGEFWCKGEFCQQEILDKCLRLIDPCGTTGKSNHEAGVIPCKLYGSLPAEIHKLQVEVEELRSRAGR